MPDGLGSKSDLTAYYLYDLKKSPNLSALQFSHL